MAHPLPRLLPLALLLLIAAAPAWSQDAGPGPDAEADASGSDAPPRTRLSPGALLRRPALLGLRPGTPWGAVPDRHRARWEEAGPRIRRYRGTLILGKVPFDEARARLTEEGAIASVEARVEVRGEAEVQSVMGLVRRLCRPLGGARFLTASPLRPRPNAMGVVPPTVYVSEASCAGPRGGKTLEVHATRTFADDFDRIRVRVVVRGAGT